MLEQVAEIGGRRMPFLRWSFVRLALGLRHRSRTAAIDDFAYKQMLLFPGAPAYREYMRKAEGRRFSTQELRAHAEYQTLIPDVVMVSTFIA